MKQIFYIYPFGAKIPFSEQFCVFLDDDKYGKLVCMLWRDTTTTLTLYSTTYPRISSPPSEDGGTHDSLHDRRVTSLTCTAPGRLGFSHGSRARTVMDAADQSPRPTRFSAATRNWYDCPSASPVTRWLVPLINWLLSARTQLCRPISRCSNWYPVTGDPPSLVGGDQVTMHESRKMLLVWGALGAAGASEIHQIST